MTYYCYEVTKTIVTTIEAEDEDAAKVSITEMIEDGEYGDSFYRAEPQFTMLYVEEAQ